MQLGRTPWPATTTARAALLGQLEAVRNLCIDHAPFLALLGAAWLDLGEPQQALLWLERALLLEPDAPGARADHALALAALGERAALVDLVEQWRDRGDIPAPLRQHLQAALLRARVGTTNGTPLTNADALGWTWRAEVALFAGHETNLDRSPRLSELTLTAPDGPIELPLAVALVPRAGQAWLAEGGLQAQYKASPLVRWQGGVQFTARHAPNEPATDQQQVQLALARVQRVGDWRAHVHLSHLWLGGRLNDPYRVTRIGAAAEREFGGCGARFGAEFDARRYTSATLSDGSTASLQFNADCPLSWVRGWSWGMAWRAGVDRPVHAERPGGDQRQVSAGLRAAGPIGAGFRLEASGRLTWMDDSLGYSPLLENNAVRRQQQQLLSAEVSRTLPTDWLPRSELVLQVQRLRQTGNLSLFSHSGTSGFAGMRWAW